MKYRAVLTAVALLQVLSSGLAQSESSALVDQSELFVFHNSPEINLHHLLYQWAKDEIPVPDKDRIEELKEGERTAIP
jgi:hypothetical protein